jgi:hypothetical protein
MNRGLRLVRSPQAPPREPPPESDVVELGGSVAANVDALDDALGLHDPTLYHRGRKLVHVLPAFNVAGVADETPIVRPITAPALLLRISRRLKCVRANPPTAKAIKEATEQGKDVPPYVPTLPSERLAIAPLMHQGYWRGIRPIRAVVESPTLRPDGSVLQTPGYDAASGYLYEQSAEFPHIPDSPTQAEAKSALWELAQVFGDFPHLNAAHRMVPVAALLTILARAAVDGPTPAFVFDATVRGSGKTMQGDVVHAIACGRRPPHATMSEKEEEREKVLSGYALIAAPVIFIDNVKGLLGGPKLEATLTSSVVGFRILGQPTITELPWLSIMLVSGNNLQLTDDMVRRCLMSRLESPLEDPTTRTEFAHPELVSWALAERPRLLALALTVLRAFLAHGSPDTGAGTLGEPYGAWSRLIPAAIVFAGGANPLECRPPKESGGLEEVGAVRALLEGWSRLDPTGSGLTSAGLVRAVSHAGEGPDGLDDLREAVETLAPPRGAKVSPLALGHALKRYRGRWTGALRLGSRKGHDNVHRWLPESR